MSGKGFFVISGLFFRSGISVKSVDTIVRECGPWVLVPPSAERMVMGAGKGSGKSAFRQTGSWKPDQLSALDV